MTNHNWPVYGHDWVVDFLIKGMRHQRTRHAYLFVGTPGIGKQRLAESFALALNCERESLDERPCLECRSCKRIISGSHIDLLYTATDEKSGQLKIDAVRSVANQLSLKPFEGRYRVAIMNDFQNARGQAQDALLKTLEEPPPYAVLLLLATSLEPVLSTITSRSQVLYLRPVPAATVRETLVNHYDVDPEQAQLLARFSGGRIGWAIKAAQNPDVLSEREQALALLDEVIAMNRRGRFDLAGEMAKNKLALIPLLELWQTYWRDVLLHTQNAPVPLANIDREVNIQQMAYTVNTDSAFAALRATQELRDRLQFNVNTRLALENMLLVYPGL